MPLIPQKFICSLAFLASFAAAPALARAQSGYTFQPLNLPPSTDRAQVRDAAVGLGVGYIIRPDPDNPGQTLLEATAWRLDTSGGFINLHRVPPDIPSGVSLLTTEALGVDDLHQIGGTANRLNTWSLDNEGAYWADPQAFPFGVSAQALPQLTNSAILDVDGRWAVGNGRRLTAPDFINDRAWAWDVTNNERFALLGPGGEDLTYASEITGRTIIGHRQLTVNSVEQWRPMVWDLGAGYANGDLSGLTATELASGGLQYAYLNGVDEARILGVGQGRGASTGDLNHAMAWDLSNPGAPPIDLHLLLPSQYEISAASDALGNLVIGSTVDPNDMANLQAIAWDLSTDTFIDLHSLLPADIVHSSGTAINRSGQIVGDFKRDDGTWGVFVLTPNYAAGDSTLDGVADVLDLQILAINYEMAGRSFFEGDITFDGSGDFADLVLMSQVYTPTANTVPGLEPFATFEEARVFFNLPPVPEPGSITLLAACGGLLLLRRKQRF